MHAKLKTLLGYVDIVIEFLNIVPLGPERRGKRKQDKKGNSKGIKENGPMVDLVDAESIWLRTPLMQLLLKAEI